MKLFNTLTRKIVASVALVAAIAGITSVAVAGFGPDRQTYTLANPADKVTFNSIVDNVPTLGGNGDERTFSTGAVDGASAWTDPVQGATNGKEVTVRAYVHNNAKTTLNLVAENVTFKAEIPTGIAQVNQIKSTISSSNATPVSVYDTVDITAGNGQYSQLEYVPGSASFKNAHFVNGVKLDDSIVASGVKLGYNALDGKIPGCLEFSGWVAFKVRVKAPNYQIAKTARLSGEGADRWRESVNAAPGDKIDYRIEFINNGATSLSNIRVYDKLPTYMKVVPGSVKLIDASNPATNPYIYPAGAVTENGTRIDILNPSTYSPNSNFFIRFQAEFANDPTIACGTHKFRNVGYAQPGSMGVVNDGTDVYLITNKTCEVVVVKECVSLTATKISRTKFDFVATGRVENATIQNYVFTAKDKNGVTVDTRTVITSATTANYTFEKVTVGEYSVSVVINTDKGVAAGTCVQKVKVDEEPKSPTYVCKDVKIDILSGRKVKITVSYDGAPANRVSLKNIEYNFGDGSTPLVTTNNPVEYTYAKDGTYKVGVKLTFAVDGVNQTVSGDACAEVVTFTSTPEEKCPYNNTLAKNDPKCEKPKELPNTGAGSMVGLFGAVTAAGMFITRRAALRK